MKIFRSSAIVICCVALACSGCGKKEEKAPAPIKRQMAKTSSPPLLDISDNPVFFNTANISAKAAEAKDLDSVIRPVLRKVFRDARIVSESAKPETKVDGEVVENKITYVVRQLMVPQEGEALHAAFKAAGFGASPRLGSKPTIWRGGAVMSLFESTGRRSYSLVINMDTNKQQIVVESYKLGSKYDRLM